VAVDDQRRLEMRHGKELTWSQVVMAANTPMLLKAGLVEGNTDAGVLASGQVAGILDDLPSCAELVESIVSDAVKHLRRRPRWSTSSRSSPRNSIPGCDLAEMTTRMLFRGEFGALMKLSVSFLNYEAIVFI
jgi:hypothetical protein